MNPQFSGSNAGSGGSRIIPIPVPIPWGIVSLIDTTRWAFAVTPSRIQLFYWVSFVVANILYFLTKFLFWVFAFMFLKSLTNWKGMLPFASALWRFRPWWLFGPGNFDLDGLWQALIPEAEKMIARSLQITLLETGALDAPIVKMIRFPLLLSNPILWTFALLIIFFFHNIFSFICRFMKLTDHASARTERH